MISKSGLIAAVVLVVFAVLFFAFLWKLYMDWIKKGT